MQLRDLNRMALPCWTWKVQGKGGEERGKNGMARFDFMCARPVVRSRRRSLRTQGKAVNETRLPGHACCAVAPTFDNSQTPPWRPNSLNPKTLKTPIQLPRMIKEAVSLPNTPRMKDRLWQDAGTDLTPLGGQPHHLGQLPTREGVAVNSP